MIEFVAYLSAQQETRDLAGQAFPEAPVRPEAERSDGRGVVLRQRLSLALRQLADRIEPAPAPARPEPAVVGC